MNEIEKLILIELLAKLRLQRARQQFGNKYVFGFDDVEIFINGEINKLK